MTAAEEYEAGFREATAAGRPPDALDQRIADEAERFRSQVAVGAEGHWYWMGSAQGYRRNDGRRQAPRRWAYAYAHGRELAREQDVWPVCGQPRCIHPEHQESGRSTRRLRYRDEQILGRLQVEAMRLGHSPTAREWDQRKLRPMREVISARFGGWERALRAAGLEPPPPRQGQRYPLSHILASLTAATEHLGHFPRALEFERLGPWLRERGYVAHRVTIPRRLKARSWAEVREFWEREKER